MKSQEIIANIVSYFENTILFLPNLTSSGLGEPIQLEKDLKIDLTNTKPMDDGNYKAFEVEDIEQAYDVIAGVYLKNRDEIKGVVDEFVREKNVDITQPLYLIAHLKELIPNEHSDK